MLIVSKFFLDVSIRLDNLICVSHFHKVYDYEYGNIQLKTCIIKICYIIIYFEQLIENIKII